MILVALFLASHGLLPCIADQAGEAQEYRSKEWLIEELPWSQRRALLAARPLGEILHAGDLSITVTEKAGVTRVGKRPGEAASRRLQHGAALSFESADLDSSDQRTRIELLFEFDQSVGWRYGARFGRVFEIDGQSLCLIDVDLNGRFDLQSDAWSLGPGAPLLPLGPVLPIGARKLHIEELEENGSSMKARRIELELSPAQRSAMERLNHLRCVEGLDPISLDPLLSSACSAHARYLRHSGWSGGGDPRVQEEGREHGSLEGRIAARHSAILPLTPAETIDALWANPISRGQLADPDLKHIGLSESEHSPTVLDLSSLRTRGDRGRRYWKPWLLSPAPGSWGQPLEGHEFRSESPLPIPRSAQAEEPSLIQSAAAMGPPLLMRWLDAGADVESYEAEFYKLSGSSRRRLPFETLEVNSRGGRWLGIAPKQALKADTWYLVVHRVRVDGEEHLFEVPFRSR